MGEVSVQVTEPRRRPVRRPGPSQIKMCRVCGPFRAMPLLMRTKVVSFFIFSQELSNKKKIKTYATTKDD